MAQIITLQIGTLRNIILNLGMKIMTPEEVKGEGAFEDLDPENNPSLFTPVKKGQVTQHYILSNIAIKRIKGHHQPNTGEVMIEITTKSLELIQIMVSQAIGKTKSNYNVDTKLHTLRLMVD